MSGSRRFLGVIPPFIVGLAGAVALESSAAALLYSAQGLLSAVTLILTVEVGALGLGLLSGPLPVGGGAVEQVRRRWLFCLVSFAVAAALSAGLEVTGDGLPRGGLGQGLGLAFFGSLPLFSLGSLLGAMARPDELPSPPVASVGSPAILGAAVGFLFLGSVLLPNVAFYSLYLFCLVALSGGALLQGWVLDARPAIEILERARGRRGEIRMEERLLGSPRREVRVLMEADRLRGAEDPDGRPARAWERAVLEAMESEPEGPGPLIYIGGGSGTLVRLVTARWPGIRVRVIEREPALVEMARRQFFSWEAPPGVTMEYRDPMDLSAGEVSDAACLVLDCAVLPFLGHAPEMREMDWRSVFLALAPGGRLILGGLRTGRGTAESPALKALLNDGRRWFDRADLYVAGAGGMAGATALLEPLDGGSEAFLVFRQTPTPAWPPVVFGFHGRVTTEE